jgi:hypothetical protein
MRLSKPRIVVFAIILSLVTLLVGGMTYSHRHANDRRIIEKFACDRLTAENRATDVFCDPEVYQNPNLSNKRFWAFIHCDDIAKHPNKDGLLFVGDAEVAESTICKDKNTLEQTRIKYNQYLERLKAENPL